MLNSSYPPRELLQIMASWMQQAAMDLGSLPSGQLYERFAAWVTKDPWA